MVSYDKIRVHVRNGKDSITMPRGPPPPCPEGPPISPPMRDPMSPIPPPLPKMDEVNDQQMGKR